MGTPLATRLALKIKRTIRELNPAEREFGGVRPLVNEIPGLLYGDEDKWLFTTARSLPDSANLVEVGSYKGRSTSCLAFGCRGSKKRVFAVDSFDVNDWDFREHGFFQEFRQNIDRCGLCQHAGAVRRPRSAVAITRNSSDAR